MGTFEPVLFDSSKTGEFYGCKESLVRFWNIGECGQLFDVGSLTVIYKKNLTMFANSKDHSVIPKLVSHFTEYLL